MTSSAPPIASAHPEKRLLGVWKIESLYTEVKATGERRKGFGEKPSGYGILTAEKRAMVIITAEGRKQPITDADRLAAFFSMVSYSGPYRVEDDRFITKVDVSWNEAWTGTEQTRFFKLEGDTLTLTSSWLPDPTTPGNPEVRFVVVWSKVASEQ